MNKTGINIPVQVFVYTVLIFTTDPEAVASIYDFPVTSHSFALIIAHIYRVFTTCQTLSQMLYKYYSLNSPNNHLRYELLLSPLYRCEN